MRIYSICIQLKNKDFVCHYELKDFGYFEKKIIKDFISFFSKELIERYNTRKETKEKIDIIKDSFDNSTRIIVYHCYLYGNHIIIYTDEEYPENVIKRLIVSDTVVKNTSSILTDYQEPHKIDSIYKIQCELDETIETCHKTIESLLNRGEKLDDLVKRSEYLNTSSKMFYTTAKKHNSCCIIT